MHFPLDRDTTYFEQLTAEKLMPVRVGGEWVTKWTPKPGRANEALDARVYAYAALWGLIHMNLRLNRLADEVGPVITPAADGEEDGAPEGPGDIVVVSASEPPPKKKTFGSRLAGRRRD